MSYSHDRPHEEIMRLSDGMSFEDWANGTFSMIVPEDVWRDHVGVGLVLFVRTGTIGTDHLRVLVRRLKDG